MSEEFDRQYWEERYSGRTAAAPPPNPQLVAEAADLAPGTALDAGCGEGADAVWLAARGWRVTAVDVAAGALERARAHAAPLGADVTDRVTWVQADLTAWAPPEEHFALVSTHYVHAAEERGALFDRLAAAVAPGGTLLIVGHHPADTGSAAHTSAPGVHFTAEEAAAGLDPGRWEVVTAAARTRPAHGHGHGHGGTIHDTVLRARKRP